MAGKDPKLVAEKWARRAAGATQDMQNGINAVTINPAEQAIAKEEKLKANWNAAMNDGKWRRGMQRVSLEGWKQAMLGKGVGRVAAGVQAAQSKQEQFYSELFPFQEQIQAKLKNMPDITTEDAINRAVTWMRESAKFKRSR